ncbi:MAG: hypothetical protein J7L47_06255 [Candidatus Odinarchaeota archaeon]|nr:hypothetical protein [Candidatus Odinarchaeota archaeon]
MSGNDSEKLKYLPIAQEWKEKNDKDEVGTWWFNLAMDYYAWQFNQMWDILKAIEKKYGVDVMSIAKEIRKEQSRQNGFERGQKAQRRGILGFWEEFVRKYEGKTRCDIKYFEFNDERLEYWFRRCPIIERFKAFGKTDEEIKEMSELFCMDVPKLAAFDPDLEVCQTSWIMRGSDHCTYIVRKFPKDKE